MWVANGGGFLSHKQIVGGVGEKCPALTTIQMNFVQSTYELLPVFTMDAMSNLEREKHAQDCSIL